MTPSVEYRAQAQKYVEQAEKAKSFNHRIILLQSAATLMRMAHNAELTQRLVEEPSS